ncbi:MAG: hypothetical protein HYY05_06335 [Chloroflexi bacterium]|nr:hypothetical protein [Chloroflexota bacterium]
MDRGWFCQTQTLSDPAENQTLWAAVSSSETTHTGGRPAFAIEVRWSQAIDPARPEQAFLTPLESRQRGLYYPAVLGLPPAVEMAPPGPDKLQPARPFSPLGTRILDRHGLLRPPELLDPCWPQPQWLALLAAGGIGLASLVLRRSG